MTFDHVHEHEPTRCPKCFMKLDRCSGGKHAPVVGDFTVCIGCAAALVYADNMSLRLLSPDDEVSRECMMEIRAIQVTIGKLKARMN